MRKSTTLVSALAIAGLALAGSAAFTGGGITNNVPNAFVGGTVTQTITGAVLQSVVYTYAGADDRSVASLVLELSGPVVGMVPSIDFVAGTVKPYTCDPLALDGVHNPNYTSTCSPSVGGEYSVDMTSLNVTLATV